MPAGDEPVAIALAYHARTKHFPGRYARALGHLDWATQPDPFRRFEGAPVLPLDESEPTEEPSLGSVLAGDGGAVARLDRAFVSRLFYDSLALSAWKEFAGTRWSLRVNPSSGNLHPTEGYLIAPAIEGLTSVPAVYHYAPFLHALEQRQALGQEVHAALLSGLPSDTLLAGLTSIHWREAWKYGERAFRYCQHDVGHAVAALAIAASALGWEARLLESVLDAEVAKLLGIFAQSGPEAERADCVLALFPRRAASNVSQWRPAAKAVDAVADGEWHGTPRPLSPDHHDWPIIDEVARAIEKRELPAPGFFAESPAQGAELPRLPSVSARRIIRQRRSAVDMDGSTRLTRDAFVRLLGATVPGANRIPFESLPWRPRVHLAVFVHRVDDVEPGLYFLARDASALPSLRAAFRSELLWEPLDALPAGLDLRLLIPADVRDAAELVSCRQAIAANGAFAVGMIAELEPTLADCGAFMYSRLHWEAGAIGQVLYLGAEAEGVRATGIGCFFDDLMHELLGISDERFGDLYHFTVGGPLDDSRLRTAPAYAHRPAALSKL